jgi:6-phosphofructokinase
VQRGGISAVFDRLLGTRSAVTAVEVLFDWASGLVTGVVGELYAILRSADAIRAVSKVPPRLPDLAKRLARLDSVLRGINGRTSV